MEDGLCPVLLVDDDPFVIAGVKLLIDWKENGFLPPESASSGQEALEKLKSLRPGVVICDIVMPDLSGIDLLKQAEDEFPCTVFIMLSAHEEFDLAQKSMRYRALEYLVKSNLEQETLEAVLKKAKLERENRRKLRHIEEADEYPEPAPRRNGLRERVQRFLSYGAELPPEDKAALAKEGMLNNYGFALIPLDFAVLPEYPEITPEERRILLDWEIELTRRLGTSFFSHILLFPYSMGAEDGVIGEAETLLLFAWGMTRENWESGTEKFREQLMKTSLQITRLGADVLASPFYAEPSSESPADDLFFMAEKYRAKGKHSGALQRAQQYILDNIQKQIMVQDIAEYAHISTGYLSTLFKKEYKRGLVDFINHVKIDRACVLLRANKYLIKEISYMLGFESAFYFSRVFHRHTGMTPSEYQAKHAPRTKA
ncbi:MAG: response regulator [Treponema sp.]|jgi:AraC-like DNA-binding protein/DNA-binding NarL/FixJ family response regulator|nr:response regulator [Treponema sp.]